MLRSETTRLLPRFHKLADHHFSLEQTGRVIGDDDEGHGLAQ